MSGLCTGQLGLQGGHLCLGFAQGSSGFGSLLTQLFSVGNRHEYRVGILVEPCFSANRAGNRPKWDERSAFHDDSRNVTGYRAAVHLHGDDRIPVVSRSFGLNRG